MLIPGQLAPVDGSEARSRLSDSLFPTPRLQGIDPGQVAPLLVVVHAETEHETIGQFNAVEIGPDALDQAVLRALAAKAATSSKSNSPAPGSPGAAISASVTGAQL